MAFEPGEGGVDEDGAKSRAETGCESFETDLDWVGWEDPAEEEREEIEQGVEIHAYIGLLLGRCVESGRWGKRLTCNEGDSVCHPNDSLAREHFMGDHGILAEFPLPYDEDDDEGDTEEHGAEHVGTAPWLVVTTSLHGHQAGRC